MDPIGVPLLATGALTVLQPYFPIIGTKVAEKLGEELPAAIGKLWKAIRQRMDVKEAAREAVEDILSNPKSESLQTVFKVQFEKLLAQDVDFRYEIESLLPEAEKDYRAAVKGGGAVAQDHSISVGERGVHIRGNASRNLIITGDNNQNPQKKKPEDD
jgi:hypothetical protein